MTGKKISKILFVWMCIITLVMPFTSEVLAAALTKESTTAVIESVPWREGGPESSGLKSDIYDEKGYSYKVSGVNVLKAIQKGDVSYSDMFYCVNAGLSLSVMKYYNYVKAAEDFTDYSDEEVKEWAEDVGISEENYKALVWLLENIYLEKQQPELKDEFLAKAFAKLIEEEADVTPPTTVEFIKERLTDDDIDVVQQWAIWYFTNGSNDKNEYYDALYNTFGQMTVSYEEFEDGEIVEVKNQALDSTRQRYAAELYNYLITSAKEAAKKPDTTVTEKVYPSIDKTKIVESTVDGEYYKVGPFKVNSGNVPATEYELKLTAEGADLSTVKYKIFVDGVEVDTPYNEIFDKEYYVYVPMAGNTITKLNLSLNYTTKGELEASLWTGTDPELSVPSQPLVLLMYVPGDPVEEEISGIIVEKYYDLALRKTIVSVDGNSIQGRTITPNVEDLAKGGHVGKYEHSKSPVVVEKGSKIVYEFRVYNEGNIDAKVNEIIDYLPEGLTVVDKTQSTINSKYNWEVVGVVNGFQVVKNAHLANVAAIPAFNKTEQTISCGVVQLECEVTGDFESGTVLTNVAQITVDNKLDIDSTANTIKPEDIDKTTYSGNKSNKEDLTDSKYFYAGLEDDDDFEKVIIEGKTFDLALQKFITKINDVDYKNSREPKVDVVPLVNGNNDANYQTVKTPLQVEVGDIVTFTLRVYNEGELAGYAEQITDYIPEGLGLLLNHNTNYDNSWEISTDAKSVKLSEIKNGTKNLKVSDFNDINSLDEVEVVLGKTKVTSKALASSATSTDNLIKAFNKENKSIDFKNIEITCIVTTDDEVTLKNIAAITGTSDEDRNPITEESKDKDRDSNPKDDIVPEDYTTGNEDDDDYDVINTSPKHYDFALQKFISAVDELQIKDREPSVTIGKDGKIVYNHSTEPLKVGNGDVIVYTIRVYNEGNSDGYVSEICDDIPKGLTFLPDHTINKDKWKMYDKSGKETNDVNQATQIRTTALSKEADEKNLIPAFENGENGSSNKLSYKDVQVAFKVSEEDLERTSTTEARIIINTAEITEITDDDGDKVEDVDSTPDNGKLDEDDIDQEKIYVKYFDLALEKNLKKIIIVEDGQTKVIDVTDPTTLMKVEIHRKKLNKTSVQFVYEIIVRNEGEIDGYVSEITDYIPEGLSFNEKTNPNWTKKADNIISTDALAKTLLKPGEKASVEVTLDWVKDENNMGKFVNTAEISEDWNEYDAEDVDSTPDNLIATEDDQDDAPVYVSIGTGLGGQPYYVLTSVVLAILATGIFLIKKYVVE